MKSFAFGLAVILAAVLVGGAQGVTQGNCSNSQLGTNSQLGCAYCPTIGGETSECVATGCKTYAIPGGEINPAACPSHFQQVDGSCLSCLDEASYKMITAFASGDHGGLVGAILSPAPAPASTNSPISGGNTGTTSGTASGTTTSGGSSSGGSSSGGSTSGGGTSTLDPNSNANFPYATKPAYCNIKEAADNEICRGYGDSTSCAAHGGGSICSWPNTAASRNTCWSTAMLAIEQAGTTGVDGERCFGLSNLPDGSGEAACKADASCFWATYAKGLGEQGHMCVNNVPLVSAKLQQSTVCAAYGADATACAADSKCGMMPVGCSNGWDNATNRLMLCYGSSDCRAESNFCAQGSCNMITGICAIPAATTSNNQTSTPTGSTNGGSTNGGSHALPPGCNQEEAKVCMSSANATLTQAVMMNDATAGCNAWRSLIQCYSAKGCLSAQGVAQCKVDIQKPGHWSSKFMCPVSICDSGGISGGSFGPSGPSGGSTNGSSTSGGSGASCPTVPASHGLPPPEEPLPLSPEEAAQEFHKLSDWNKLMTWLMDFYISYFDGTMVKGCKAISQAYKDFCGPVTDAQCAAVTDVESDLAKACCHGNKKNAKCNDARDTWRVSKNPHSSTSNGCCDECISSGMATPEYKASCVGATLQGASVCGEDADGKVKPDETIYFRKDLDDNGTNTCTTGPDHEEDGADCDERDGCAKVCTCKATYSNMNALMEIWRVATNGGTQTWRITFDEIKAWKDSTTDIKKKQAYSGFEAMFGRSTRSFVMNTAGTVKKAELDVGGKDSTGMPCSMGAMEAYTEGEMKVKGGDLYVFKPTTTSDGKLEMTGTAAARVIGGTNAGTVAVTSTGKLRIHNLTNTGPVTINGATNVFLSNIVNKKGGDISMTKSKVTLYNINNEAGTTTTMDGGVAYGYKINNMGNVVIKSGSVTLALTANTGTITFEAGTSGTITVPEAFRTRGTIVNNAGTGVTVVYLADSGGTIGGGGGGGDGGGGGTTIAPAPAPGGTTGTTKGCTTVGDSCVAAVASHTVVGKTEQVPGTCIQLTGTGSGTAIVCKVPDTVCTAKCSQCYYNNNPGFCSDSAGSLTCNNPSVIGEVPSWCTGGGGDTGVIGGGGGAIGGGGSSSSSPCMPTAAADNFECMQYPDQSTCSTRGAATCSWGSLSGGGMGGISGVPGSGGVAVCMSTAYQAYQAAYYGADTATCARLDETACTNNAKCALTSLVNGAPMKQCTTPAVATFVEGMSACHAYGTDEAKCNADPKCGYAGGAFGGGGSHGGFTGGSGPSGPGGGTLNFDDLPFPATCDKVAAKACVAGFGSTVVASTAVCDTLAAMNQCLLTNRCINAQITAICNSQVSASNAMLQSHPEMSGSQFKACDASRVCSNIPAAPKCGERRGRTQCVQAYANAADCKWTEFKVPRKPTLPPGFTASAWPAELNAKLDLAALGGSPAGAAGATTTTTTGGTTTTTGGTVLDALDENFPTLVTACTDQATQALINAAISLVKPTLDCLLNEDASSCRAMGAQCGFVAPSLCLKKADADAMTKQIDANRGVGIGDAIVACAAKTAQSDCAVDSKCGWVASTRKCTDSASAAAVQQTESCKQYKTAASCDAAANCGFVDFGPGMSFCVDQNTADIARETVGRTDRTDDASSTTNSSSTTTTAPPSEDPADSSSSSSSSSSTGADSSATTTTKVGTGLTGLCGTQTCGAGGREACAPCGIVARPVFGCAGKTSPSGSSARCDADASCKWIAPGSSTTAATASTRLDGTCIDASDYATVLCGSKVAQATCESDASCGWADVGRILGFSDERCVEAGEKALLEESTNAFDGGSKDLKNLGSNVVKAASTLLKKAEQGEAAADITKLTGKDVKAVIGQISKQVEGGAKLGAADADKLMDKIKDASTGGWGAVSGWTEDQFEEAESLLPGLDTADIDAVPKAEFEKAMDSFGKQMTWAAEQVDALAKKFKEVVSDFSTLTATTVAKAKGFIAGVAAPDLAKIPTAEFKKAAASIAEAAQKIGAFAADQLDVLGHSVGEAFGDATDFSGDTVEELGALVGCLPVANVSKIPAAALAKMKPSAIKTMGGAKAAQAFTADKLKLLPDAAKAAFNGADIAAVAEDKSDDGKAKLRTILGCEDDESTCPGAIVDVVIASDGSKTDDELVARISQQLSAAGVKVDGLKLQQAATPFAAATAASGSSRRRRHRRQLLQGAAAARQPPRLLAETTGNNMQTVVRAETATNAAAEQAALATASEGSAATVVPVTAQDGGGDLNNGDPTLDLGAAPRDGLPGFVIPVAAGCGAVVLVGIIVIAIVVVRKGRKGGGVQMGGRALQQQREKQFSIDNPMQAGGGGGIEMHAPSGGMVPPIKAPAGGGEGGVWQEALDPASGQTYFINTQTGETQWENPVTAAGSQMKGPTVSVQ